MTWYISRPIRSFIDLMANHFPLGSESSERGRPGFRPAHEVDEFEMRDDLVAWRLPGLSST